MGTQRPAWPLCPHADQMPSGGLFLLSHSAGVFKKAVVFHAPPPSPKAGSSPSSWRPRLGCFWVVSEEDLPGCCRKKTCW